MASNFRRGSGSDETVELEGRPETRTAKAVLVEWTNSGGSSWVPKSQIVSELPNERDGTTVYQITEWFAKKEGLV